MKKTLLVPAFLLAGISFVFAWGAWGHQHINRAAVFALPDGMRPFFYNHIDFITEESVIPDQRKYTINDRAEFPRHYINMETYGEGAEQEGKLPQTMQEAKALFADTLMYKAGILPWYIQEVEEKLTKAFKAGRKSEILFLAADLGHYIGDAHMPLHTALNHNGQLTGQKGIHAFWEGQLPEMFGEGYNLFTGEAKYIPDIPVETWRMIYTTHRLADTLLAIDRDLSAGMPKEKIFRMDSSGQILTNAFGDLVHTQEYAKKYHEHLHGMIEQQLRKAIAETADYWYTAWVNAGKPDLSGLDPAALTERNKNNLKKDLRHWQGGKVDLFKANKEFPL